jgi:hypothetical protein
MKAYIKSQQLESSKWRWIVQFRAYPNATNAITAVFYSWEDAFDALTVAILTRKCSTAKWFVTAGR